MCRSGIINGQYLVDEVSVVDLPPDPDATGAAVCRRACACQASSCSYGRWGTQSLCTFTTGSRDDVQVSPAEGTLHAITVLRNPLRAASKATGAPDDELVPDAAFACGTGATCAVLDAVLQQWVPDPTPASIAAEADGTTSSTTMRGLWSYVTDDGFSGGVWAVGTDGTVMVRDPRDMRAVAAASGTGTGVSGADLARESETGASAWSTVTGLPHAVASVDLFAVAGSTRGGGLLATVCVVGTGGVAAVFAASDNSGVVGEWHVAETGVTADLLSVVAVTPGLACVGRRRVQ